VKIFISIYLVVRTRLELDTSQTMTALTCSVVNFSEDIYVLGEPTSSIFRVSPKLLCARTIPHNVTTKKPTI
jgi:hypothetical protein